MSGDCSFAVGVDVKELQVSCDLHTADSGEVVDMLVYRTAAVVVKPSSDFGRTKGGVGGDTECETSGCDTLVG